MAEEEQESERGFRVQDRRRFSSKTGEARVPDGEDSKPEQRATDTQQAGSDGSDRQQPQDKAPQAETSSGVPQAELSFSSFILGLSTQALMYMGEVAGPGQSLPTDLAAAKEMIDILTMLQQKTTGNLDSNEHEMIESILFDLRMRYVELASKRR